MAAEEEKSEKMRKKIRNRRRSTLKVSFSASLPGDVRGIFADSICAVKYSLDPLADFRESIIEMIHEVGVEDWEEMEELVYCYVVLNSANNHGLIADAFLGLCCSCL
ncbi:transcription repressor OFP4-like [Aristolochia californica]|uniref:transcription repressor OFP4-like n=1 Tax=Aristolochia californica TaxID=171875 RepID=UPI0035D6BEF6